MTLPSYTTTALTKNRYKFTTDSDHCYTVYFESAAIFNDNRVDPFTVYFGFTCDPPLKVYNREHDARIGITIMDLTAKYFTEHPLSIICYVCSALDKQDRHRNIAFGRWYNASSLNTQFKFLRRRTSDAYCGVLYNAAHPDISVIEDTFTDFNLDDKPGMAEEKMVMYGWEEEWEEENDY